MKIKFLSTLLLAGILAVPTVLTVRVIADDTAKATKPKDIYDAAIGAKQVDEAVAKANKEGKRVLLQFGANWCPWCHRLHDLFKSDEGIAAALKRDYVVLLIDVDKDRNADLVARYHQPTKLGLPVIVILDGDGKQLTTQDTGKLEEGDHHSPVKVMDFLKRWAPKNVATR